MRFETAAHHQTLYTVDNRSDAALHSVKLKHFAQSCADFEIEKKPQKYNHCIFTKLKKQVICFNNKRQSALQSTLIRTDSY